MQSNYSGTCNTAKSCTKYSQNVCSVVQWVRIKKYVKTINFWYKLQVNEFIRPLCKNSKGNFGNWKFSIKNLTHYIILIDWWIQQILIIFNKQRDVCLLWNDFSAKTLTKYLSCKEGAIIIEEKLFSIQFWYF